MCFLSRIAGVLLVVYCRRASLSANQNRRTFTATGSGFAVVVGEGGMVVVAIVALPLVFAAAQLMFLLRSLWSRDREPNSFCAGQHSCEAVLVNNNVAALAVRTYPRRAMTFTYLRVGGFSSHYLFCHAAQHETAQHETARHETARHETARHETRETTRHCARTGSTLAMTPSCGRSRRKRPPRGTPMGPGKLSPAQGVVVGKIIFRLVPAFLSLLVVSAFGCPACVDAAEFF